MVRKDIYRGISTIHKRHTKAAKRNWYMDELGKFLLQKYREQQYTNKWTAKRVTWPGPSLANMISKFVGPIGSLENSGRESWLQLNEVNVLGFEPEFGLTSSAGNSLPLGNHFSSFDFTALKVNKIKQRNRHRKSIKWMMVKESWEKHLFEASCASC